jgi:transcriptional regulator with XRE-family HTH domain
MRIGDVIRSYRYHQEMSRRELAESMHMRLETVRQVEQGNRPTQHTLQHIVAWLTEDTETEDN